MSSDKRLPATTRRALVTVVAVFVLAATLGLSACDLSWSLLDDPRAREVEVQQLLEFLIKTYVFREYVGRVDVAAISGGQGLPLELEDGWARIVSIPVAFELDWTTTGPSAGIYSRPGAPASVTVENGADWFRFGYLYADMPTRPLLDDPDFYPELTELFGAYHVDGSLLLERTNMVESTVQWTDGSVVPVLLHDGSLTGSVDLRGGRVTRVEVSLSYTTRPNPNASAYASDPNLLFDTAGTIAATFANGDVQTIAP